MARYDYLIVGAGIFGSVFAQQATQAGKRVLVIDKRNHVAGNCYTKEVHGIQVHKYGPHIFHTNSDRIWYYVNRFASFNHFTNRVKVNHQNNIYSFPINLMTLNQVFGVTTPADADECMREQRLNIPEPKNLEEWCLSQLGETLYEMFIKGYTAKQWMRDPKDLPASIIKRLPIRLTYDDNYYNDRYQGIPIGGYTRMIENMLGGIDLMLGIDFKDMRLIWQEHADTLVYTGPIDEFFDYKHGELEYRTLEFHEEVHDGDYQGVAQMNYAEASIPWTRIVEHKHFEFGRQDKTVITKEYPVAWDRGRIPYYPINDAANEARHALYVSEAKQHPEIIFGGRLADFRYLDMDQVIGSALAAARDECF